MATTIDAPNKIIDLDASITDLVAFHDFLRDWEDSAEAIIYPVTHTWKRLELGGGAFIAQMDLTNGWQLRFAQAGDYQIIGNLNGGIIRAPGVFIERKTSAAYTTTVVGSGGAVVPPTTTEIANKIRQELTTELLAILQTQTKIDATF